jgi:branched-subunit amino acid ABC-type transport system permease component
MTLETFCMQILNGLTIGSIFILLSSGLTIVFGLQGITNCAHGVFYMLGAYLAIKVVMPLAGNYWLALVIAFLFNFGLGCLMEYTGIRFLVQGKREGTHVLVLTLGLAILIRELVKIIWGAVPQLAEAPAALQGTVTVGPVTYPVYWLFVILFTAAIMGALGFLFMRTGLGILVQSITLNSEVSQALGTNAPRINTAVFGLGTGIAGIAGVLSGPILGVEPNMVFDLLIVLFVVIIFGGLGSLLGVVVSGIIVGMIISFGTALMTGMIAKILAFVVMIAVLLVRPLGLFGKTGILD